MANGCSSTPKWLAIGYATHGHEKTKDQTKRGARSGEIRRSASDPAIRQRSGEIRCLTPPCFVALPMACGTAWDRALGSRCSSAAFFSLHGNPVGLLGWAVAIKNLENPGTNLALASKGFTCNLWNNTHFRSSGAKEKSVWLL